MLTLVKPTPKTYFKVNNVSIPHRFEGFGKPMRIQKEWDTGFKAHCLGEFLVVMDGLDEFIRLPKRFATEKRHNRWPDTSLSRKQDANLDTSCNTVRDWLNVWLNLRKKVTLSRGDNKDGDKPHDFIGVEDDAEVLPSLVGPLADNTALQSLFLGRQATGGKTHVGAGSCCHSQGGTACRQGAGALLTRELIEYEDAVLQAGTPTFEVDTGEFNK